MPTNSENTDASSAVEVDSDGSRPTLKRFRKRGEISLKISGLLSRSATRKELEAEIERQIRGQDNKLPDEVVKSIVEEIAADVKLDQTRDRFGNRVLRLLLPIVIAFFMATLLSMVFLRQALEPMIEKAPIQKDILAAIKNGAEVEMLKIVFKTRSTSRESIAVLLRSNDFYPNSNVTLMDVLNDLKTNILVREDTITDQEKQLIRRIDDVIVEYSKVNPFDGLEENQKRDLTNLAKKLPADSYAKVSDDFASLVVELKQKNGLVTKYLNSSDISLWLSIIALALTIGLAVWQFRPKARKTQKELIQEALAEFNVNKVGEKS